MLNIKNLKVSVENKLILNDLNLKINPGEVHAIMGPNGSGKSTLANVLSGKKGYEIQGEILFDELNINDIAVKSVHKKGYF
jgi:Fe-S cluster assembly ATP-binding protein